jgi:hypothetical protein
VTQALKYLRDVGMALDEETGAGENEAVTHPARRFKRSALLPSLNMDDP